MSNENTSGLEPLGRAVLVVHYQPERKKSVIEIPDEYAARDLMLEQRAIVVEVGPSCWPDESPRAKPGDKVLISRLAGHMCKGTLDGKQYRLINDRDIFCKIVKEAEND